MFFKTNKELTATNEQKPNSKTFDNIHKQIADLLETDPDNIVIKYVSKVGEVPEQDPLTALNVLKPFLEKNEELLREVERTVQSSLSLDGEYRILMMHNNSKSSSLTSMFRRNRI